MNKNIAVAALVFAVTPVAALANDKAASCDAQYDAYKQLFSVELHNGPEYGDFLKRYNEVSKDRDYSVTESVPLWETEPLPLDHWSHRHGGDGASCAREVSGRREELQGYIKGYGLAKALYEKMMAERVGPKTFKEMLGCKLEHAFPGAMGREKFKVKDVIYAYLGEKARQELDAKKEFLEKVKKGKITDADAADAKRFAGGPITKAEVHRDFDDDKKVFKAQARGMAADIAASLKTGRLDDAPAGLAFVTSRRKETAPVVANNDNKPRAPQSQQTAPLNNNNAPVRTVAEATKDPGDPMCEGAPKNAKLTRYSCIASGGRAYQISNTDLIALYAGKKGDAAAQADVLKELNGRLNELRPGGQKRAALLGMARSATIPVTPSAARVDRGHGVIVGDAEVPSPQTPVVATTEPAPPAPKQTAKPKNPQAAPEKLWKSAHGAKKTTLAKTPAEQPCPMFQVCSAAAPKPEYKSVAECLLEHPALYCINAKPAGTKLTDVLFGNYN
jgi:hypothetical protein